jgi:hypothetical protein
LEGNWQGLNEQTKLKSGSAAKKLKMRRGTVKCIVFEDDIDGTHIVEEKLDGTASEKNRCNRRSVRMIGRQNEYGRWQECIKPALRIFNCLATPD